MSTSLIGSLSIEALVAARDNAVATFNHASEILATAKAQLDVFGVRWPSIEVERHNICGVTLPYQEDRDGRDRKALANEIDRQCWSELFNKTNVRQLMSAKKRDELDKSLQPIGWNGEPTFLAFTVENIETTMAGLHEQRVDLFEESVVGLFRSLSWDHKTNSPFRMQQRMIVRSYQFDYNDRHELYDLERVLALLDGQAVPDYTFGLRTMRHAEHGVWHEVKAERRPLLAIKIFSSTIHAKLLVPAQLDTLNRIIAKHYPGVLKQAP